MPMIIVRYVTPKANEDFRRPIADLAARLAHETLGKDPDVTAVLAREIDGEWLA